MLSPSEQSDISKIRTIPNQVKITFRIVQVTLSACDKICSCSCNNHPHHIVIEIISIPVIATYGSATIPVGSHMIAHIFITRLENIEVTLVASSLIEVEYCLKGLCFIPSTIDKRTIPLTLILQILCKESVEHTLPCTLVKTSLRFYLLKMPYRLVA